MNTKRSYLDNLNAGRQRRSGPSLDEISRTLEDIETRLERAAEMKTRRQQHGGNDRNDLPDASGGDDIARRMERLSQQLSRPSAPREEPQERTPQRDLARELENSRRQEDEVAFVGRIARELQALREEVGTVMSSGLRHEFESLREETARAADRRWDDFDRRWQALEDTMASSHRDADDPTIQALTARLEQINDAVTRLPESLSLRSLEDKVRTLAGALEQVVEQQRLSPDVTSLLDERLDEITRAIAASAPSASAPTFDPEPFERIEARIASLAHQVEELAEDRPGSDVAQQLNTLTQRIDEIARQAELPDESTDRLSNQIAAISEKLDNVATPQEAEAIVQGFEERFARLSTRIEQHRGEAIEHGRSLFNDLETRLSDIQEKLGRLEPDTQGDAAFMAAIDARFADLTAHLEERARDTSDVEALQSVEARLEDISARLQNASATMSGVDTEVIRNLETQVAGLSEHLANPGLAVPEFEDIGPRLEHIEHTIAENREALFEAARRAAEEAIGALNGSRAEAGGADELADEIRALETIARKSDERNTKTFEAIHDTLLKIVDRLGALDIEETEEEERAAHGAPEKIAIETVPPIETGEDEEPLLAGFETGEDEDDIHTAGQRSPAQAAAEAAGAAALSDQDKEPTAPGEKRSVLGGLTRAFTARREPEGAPAERQDPELQSEAAASPVEDDGALDARDINEPLEPGSGAPDLNTIMKRVRDENGAKTGASDADTAKSDFIAAARRAAQAAAAEAEIQKNTKSDTGTKSRGLGIGRILRGHKKSALMAVAGFVVIAGGLYVAQSILFDGHAQAPAQAAATTDGPTAEPSVAETPDQTAKTAALGMDSEAESEMLPGDSTVDAAPADRDGSLDADSDTMTDAAETATADPIASVPTTDAAEPAMQADDETPRNAADRADTMQAREDIGAPIDADTMQPTDTASEETTGTMEGNAAAPGAGQAADVQEVSLTDIPVDAGPVALRDAASNGDPKAMFEIANRYADGRGVETDMARSAAWYAKAAEKNLAPAQYRIGNFRKKGIGVDRDIDKAKAWYEKAAKQGNASAMHNLGVLFAMGAGGEADNKAAGHWFQKAAELGVKDSQFNLGILSTKGAGVPRDLTEAYKWFALVADKGDSDAAAKRDEIANALDEDDLEKARAKAELWKPKSLDRDANVVDVPDAWTEGETTTASVDMGKAITNVQLILKKNGYDAGPADGVMGERTRSAIRAYQADNDMQPTGQIDRNLVQALLKNK